MEGISGEFATLTRGLANWMSDFSDRLDGLGHVSNQPDKQEQQLEQLQVCISDRMWFVAVGCQQNKYIVLWC